MIRRGANRSANLEVMMETAQTPDGIALCLSGGGFRATLFHLGVIRALRQFRIGGDSALNKVTEIYSVSGGSILAAHLLVNYKKYTGSDADFALVEKELLAFAGRDIRNRVLRRWGLTGLFGGSRSYWLQKEYSRLLKGMSLSDCYKATPDAPTVYILATDFRSGELCSFSRTTFERMRRSPGGVRADQAPAGQLAIAFAVAASSSFPPLFPPIELTPRMLGSPDDDAFSTSILLSDGGVYDNFGVDMYAMRSRTTPAPSHLLVSHAGGSFDTAPGKTYDSVLSRNIRASDIMMRRVGESTLQNGSAVAGAAYGLVRISETVQDGLLELSTQQMLRLVRTDLDRFEPKLAHMIIEHGQRIGGSICRQKGWAEEASVPAKPEISERSAVQIAERAAHRTWLPLCLDFRDFGVLVLWWAIGLALTAAIGMISYSAWEARRIEAVERSQQRTQLNDLSDRLERVRRAVQTKNFAEIETALAGTIVATERLAADPASKPLSPAAVPTPAETRQIVEATAPLVTLAQTNRKQLVYIQFAGSFTRGQITSLNQALKQAGWNAQGASGERTTNAIGYNEVRYSGSNKAAAEELADAVNRVAISAKPVVTRQMSSIGSDKLELWISN